MSRSENLPYLNFMPNVNSLKAASASWAANQAGVYWAEKNQSVEAVTKTRWVKETQAKKRRQLGENLGMQSVWREIDDAVNYSISPWPWIELVWGAGVRATTMGLHHTRNNGVPSKFDRIKGQIIFGVCLIPEPQLSVCVLNGVLPGRIPFPNERGRWAFFANCFSQKHTH